ncbi:tripartite tricarboxylate transporter substrate binding protein [Variovorax sp. Sphag1AA]|uniref:Bug family tripartite tricarboxylate transporter substrate binding protein n=1 Tax=Variovorax sp. Sphag1AA TaxID=2587027 RepID=UPI00161CE6FE|nr:tripartite tricarboxylate transporter substrate binding protein [Variovorax sp. Sphag1AA]MBB3182078.1 tripartite-type tricarboxylate transporter receptor subunit TctC [Variovorax sp. Sphag1AA]
MKRLLSLFAALAVSLSAMAASYPDKPVRIVVPYSPGGGGDVVGRPLSQELGKQLGGSFYIDNRGGAGGNIGMEYVAQSPADGYAVVLALTSQLAINQALYPKLHYDALNDFVPITLLGSAPYFLAVNSSLPVKNLDEFIKLAKSKPGGMSYASTGNGSGLHLSMELLKSMAGIDLVHVPYKGGGAALTDLLSGNVQAMFVSYGTGSAQIKAGKIRVLAVTSSQRSSALPDVPTIAEAGVPGYESGVWYALLAPRGTPPEIVKRLHDGSVAALQSKDLRERFASDGVKTIGSTPEELTKYIQSERVKWADVVKRSGATVE